MDKVIVIRHSDEELPNTKYTANLKKNEDAVIQLAQVFRSRAIIKTM